VVRSLVIALVDLLLCGVERCVLLALAGKAAVLRLWDDAGVREFAFERLDFLLAWLRALAQYLHRLRTRTRYRVFFDRFTAELAGRYRTLRRG
jgi:hypothetical protein